jgi:hypothetical protein
MRQGPVLNTRGGKMGSEQDARRSTVSLASVKLFPPPIRVPLLATLTRCSSATYPLQGRRSWKAHHLLHTLIGGSLAHAIRDLNSGLMRKKCAWLVTTQMSNRSIWGTATAVFMSALAVSYCARSLLSCCVGDGEKRGIPVLPAIEYRQVQILPSFDTLVSIQTSFGAPSLLSNQNLLYQT